MSEMPEHLDEASLECAKINFERVEKVLPEILKLKLYVLAKYQLDIGLGYKVDDEFKRRIIEIEKESEK